jgi:decaprenylphospho-beta-D-ribofuranose 2-oxidase
MKLHRNQQLRSFGRFAAGQSDVYQPTNVDEVNEVFQKAKPAGPRIAIRGGGHSFDGQGLHVGDTGKEIVLSSESFEPERIDFDLKDANRVTLGSGVPWGRYIEEALRHARKTGTDVRIPGSIQTGSKATVGGTLSGDCLSRFSGTSGKESKWIDSFRIVTPTSKTPIEVTEESDPDLFHAVIGGQGYIGFVTDATYKLVPIDHKHCVRTELTSFESFGELLQAQLELVDRHAKSGGPPEGISSAWFTDSAVTQTLRLGGGESRKVKSGAPGDGMSDSWANLEPLDATIIRAGIFYSRFVDRSHPKVPGFPLYEKLDSKFRYVIERASRVPCFDWLFDQSFCALLKKIRAFENELKDFLFFMDGDAFARARFERTNKPQLFPIVQQTFVIPTSGSENFAKLCVAEMLKRKIEPSESDLLFVRGDECFMSANYKLDGFAISFAFEADGKDGKPPQNVISLLRDLSAECHKADGRIHLTKNVHADRDVFRKMFSPQIETFESIKRRHDPEGLLGNPFSDCFFEFPRRRQTC